uniref:Uncharacterized protein n=1 Tax=Tanacetum cinerariifolium TaxID=118510 RepID=A0A6L2MYM2_TANCI|nr:hypothetical protein [Tanacetum cinerariifolium]
MQKSDVSIDTNDPSIMNAKVVNLGSCVDVTHVDQNVTQLDHNVGGFIVSVSSASRDTNGPSDVQTCIRMVENTRPISYINVVPTEPTTVSGSTNSVTKEPVLTVNTKGHLSVCQNLKNPRQYVRGVQVGQNLGFKPAKQVYQPVSKKNDANTNGKKKQTGLTRHETPSGAFDSPTTTSLAKLINNLERQILEDKLVLVDDDGKPLRKVDYPDTNNKVKRCVQ